MKSIRFAGFCVLALVLLGCAFQPSIPVYPQDYTELLDLSKNDPAVPVDIVIDRFLEQELEHAELIELIKHENQAFALRDHPLRLGPTASAIQNRFYPSYVAHMVLTEFYEHLNHDFADVHRAWVARISDYMTRDRDGSIEKPYRAVTIPQAIAFLVDRGERVIGAVYDGTETHPLLIRITVAREESEAESFHFDITESYSKLVADYEENASEALDAEQLRAVVVGLMANQRDTAAQLSFGIALARQDRIQAARELLNRALRAENHLANLALGRLYVRNAFNTNNENVRRASLARARNYYEAGIASGHDQALVFLASLYIDGYYPDESADRGLELLERSKKLGNIDAALLLANVFSTTRLDEPDYLRAVENLHWAAGKGDTRARILLVRLLTNPDTGLELTEQAYDWLRESAADKEDANTKIALGNCYAKGCLAKPNFRKARRWYRRAVNAAPESAEVINEVAWTLVVSDLEKLRHPKYALRIMDDIMSNDEEARSSPAYIDTWAAAHAATGDFERALELQREALDRALKSDFSSEQEIRAIQDHLEIFTNEQTVTEAIP